MKRRVFLCWDMMKKNNPEQEEYVEPEVSLEDVMYEVDELVRHNERVSDGLTSTYDHLGLLYVLKKVLHLVSKRMKD